MRFEYYIKGLFFVVVVAFIYSCSPQSNYKVLSVLFDGVPNPYIADSIQKEKLKNRTDSVIAQTLRPSKPEFVIHPPYQEKDCAFCHDQKVMGRLLFPMPGLCYQCHENFNDQYSVLHGPVEAGFCTECHNPHLTKNEKLLILIGQELCLKCHDAGDVLKNEAHIDMGDTNCTECHNPHGGDDRFILN